MTAHLFPVDTSAFGRSGCLAAWWREGEDGVKGSTLSSAAARLVHSIFAEVRVAIVHVSCVSVVLCPRGLSPGCPNLGKRKQQSTKCCRSPRRDRHLFRILFSSVQARGRSHPLHRVLGLPRVRRPRGLLEVAACHCETRAGPSVARVSTDAFSSSAQVVAIAAAVAVALGLHICFLFSASLGVLGFVLILLFFEVQKKRCLCRSTHGGRKANQKVGVACAFPQDIRGASVAHGSGV